MKITKTELILSIVSFVFFNLFAAPLAIASSTASVTATVTAQNISLSVADGSISYGTLALDASKSTLSGGVNNQQTATNTGNVAIDLTIKGQNSTNWTLDSANAVQDHYVHKFCVSSCGTEGSPTNFTALTTSYAALGAGNVSASGTQTFDLRITTPQTSSVYTSQSVDVTVQAAAH